MSSYQPSIAICLRLAPYRLLGGLFGGLVSACALHVPADRLDPPVALPTTFRGAGGDASDAVVASWWTTFGDPTLNRLVASALAGNLDVQAAWARVDQAGALLGIAGAAGVPTVGLDVGSSLSSPVAFGSGDTNPTLQHQALLGIGWEFDFFGKAQAQRRAATLDRDAAEDDAAAAAEALAGGVATVWFQWVEQRALEQLLDAQQDIARRVLRVVELRFASGSASAAEVLQQRQQIAALEVQRPAFESRRRLFEHQLALLLGRPASAPLELPDLATLPTLPAPPATGVPMSLLTRRADVRAAHRRALAADARIAVAVADKLPTFKLSLSTGLSARDIGQIFEQWLVQLAGSMNLPIADGGRRDAEEDRTRAVLAERLWLFGRAVLVALREVEDALVQEAAQTRALALLDAQLDVGRAALAELQRRYAGGVGDFLPLLTAQQALTQAESARLSAERQRLTARVALHQALGGAVPERPPVLQSPTKPDASGAVEELP